MDEPRIPCDERRGEVAAAAARAVRVHPEELDGLNVEPQMSAAEVESLRDHHRKH
jgi:hypothetical protein